MGFVANIASSVLGGGGGGDGSFQAEAPKLIEHNYLQDLGNALTPLTNGLSSATNTGQRQTSLADLLDAQSRGQGPSVAQDQLQAATDRTGQQAAGLMASQRGLNPALAARQVLQQQAAANQAAANQSAQLRAQEMLGARQLYGQNLASQRSQDIGQYQAAGDVANIIGTLQNNQNNNRVGGASQANSANASMAGAKMKQQGDLTGGILQGAGSALGSVLGIAAGGKIPGEAEVPGDSPKNDKVPAWLSPGEIVIPRSIAHDPDAARDFVARIIKGKKYSDGGPVQDDPEKEAPKKPKKLAGTSTGGDTASPTDTSTETGGSSPGGASTGGVGSGIGGAGTGGAATGGASTGGAGTVNVTISGNSGTGSNKGGSKGGKGKGKGGGSESPININISNVGGKTDAGNTTSGDGPGASGEGGSGKGSGGGGGGAAPSEPENFSSSHKDTAKKVREFAEGGEVSSPTKTSTSTGGSSPGGASTGGVGSGLGGAGTGGAATGGASTGGAGTVNATLSGNSGTGSNGSGGKGKESPIKINDVGGRTKAGNVNSGAGPGAYGAGGRGEGSGGGGGGAAPSEPGYSEGGEVRSNAHMSREFMQALKEHNEPGPKEYSRVLAAKRKARG